MNPRQMHIVISIPEPANKADVMDFITDKVGEWSKHLHPEYTLHDEFKNARVKEMVQGDTVK